MISWESPKYLKLLTILTLFWGGLVSAQESEIGIKISKRFSKHRISKISDDLSYLVDMPKWKKLDAVEKRVLGIESHETQDIFNWLDRRVSFLIPEDLENRNQISFGRDTNLYPSFNVFPKDVNNLYLFTDNSSRTLMSNYGVSYYFLGKRISKEIKVDLSYHFTGLPRPMRIFSPRVGIIAIHDDFFKSHLYISKLGRSTADSILRLSYLFHEARHSDGNGESLGFYHMRCPPGTDYAGKPACDRASNGPYMIGAIFLKKSLEVCTDCTEEEKDSLRLHFFDSRGRIMNRKVLTPDEVERVNELENKLDETAHQIFSTIGDNAESRKAILEKEIQRILLDIKTIKASDDAAQAIYWDSTPEFIGINNE